MIDGTAASRSTTAPKGRASRLGAYWVRNTAIPIATGTASTSALTELSTVTMSRSRIPNASLFGSLVLNLALVKKFAWLTRNDGTARSNRNTAINRIATTIVEPAAAAINLNSRSARRPTCSLSAVSAGFSAVDGLIAVPRVTTTSGYVMALMEVDNLALNESGIGM